MNAIITHSASRRVLAAAGPKILACRPLASTTSGASLLQRLHHRGRTFTSVHGFGSSVGPRTFVQPQISLPSNRPKLILISGCTGTGKSTFGMSVALDQGILKCISTDTIRAVMRSFISPQVSPALHRSSYSPSGSSYSEESISSGHFGDDPVASWRETCNVLATSVEGLVEDAMTRGVSLVLEGVHVVPATDLIRKWEDSGGGVGVGCLLTIRDEEAHRALLRKRGITTGKEGAEEKKIEAFERVRAIQEEMIRMATEADWMLIKQRLEPDPLELVSAKLWARGGNRERGDVEIEFDWGEKEEGGEK